MKNKLWIKKAKIAENGDVVPCAAVRPYRQLWIAAMTGMLMDTTSIEKRKAQNLAKDFYNRQLNHA